MAAAQQQFRASQVTGDFASISSDQTPELFGMSTRSMLGWSKCGGPGNGNFASQSWKVPGSHPFSRTITFFIRPSFPPRTLWDLEISRSSCWSSRSSDGKERLQVRTFFGDIWRMFWEFYRILLQEFKTWPFALSIFASMSKRRMDYDSFSYSAATPGSSWALGCWLMQDVRPKICRQIVS